MPKPKAVFRHWNKKLLNYGREVDSQRICFACLREGSVQRCHIQPLAEGGSNKSENLHLLCPNCHSESEGYSGRFYWIWFENKDLVFLPLYRNIERANLSIKFAELLKKEAKEEYLKVSNSDRPEDFFELFLKFLRKEKGNSKDSPNPQKRFFP